MARLGGILPRVGLLASVMFSSSSVIAFERHLNIYYNISCGGIF